MRFDLQWIVIQFQHAIFSVDLVGFAVGALMEAAVVGSSAHDAETSEIHQTLPSRQWEACHQQAICPSVCIRL